MSNSEVTSDPVDISLCKDGLKTQLLKTFRAHALLIIIVLVYAGATYITAAVYGVTDKVRLSLYSRTLFFATWWFSLVFFVGYAIRVVIVIRPEHPIRYIAKDLRAKYLTNERLLLALPIIIFIPLFFSAFTSFKSMIPVINPFCWDSTFARWDAAIHGGHQPWRLLHPIFAHPLLTSAISLVYNLWFMAMFGFLYWQTLSLRDQRLRRQYILTYTLCWILIGTLAAIVFSSAGPCFYGRVVPGQEDIYRPLMEYLYSANESYPIVSLDPQEMLWEAFENRHIGFLSGISAMPSMHMSMAILFVLVSWRTNRLLVIAFSIFAFLTMIGMVHLGWHYAIDGYVAAIATLFIWWVVGRLLSRYGPEYGLPHRKPLAEKPAL